MEKHKHELDSDSLSTDSDASSLDHSPRKKPKLDFNGYSPCFHDSPNSKLLVGAYKPDHETDNRFRRAVHMTFDHHGREVYDLQDTNADCQRPWPSDLALKQPKRVKPRHIQWLDKFDISGKHERGSRIFSAMVSSGLTQRWGWASYTHMVNDPGFRLEYERRQDLMRSGRYWVPSFEVSRWAPEHEFDYQQGFVLEILDVLDRMSVQAKTVAMGILASSDFAVRQKACQELYTAVRRQADMLTDLLDTDRLLWTEVVEAKANYSLQL